MAHASLHVAYVDQATMRGEIARFICDGSAVAEADEIFTPKETLNDKA
jgi:hypothetical protein